MKLSLRPLWWMILAFVATAFLAIPAAFIGYPIVGAAIGGIAVLGTLFLLQLPIMLWFMRGNRLTFGKPDDAGSEASQDGGNSRMHT